MAISEKDTFDVNGSTAELETIEWDDLWFQNADDTENKKRVLLIGDSITRAYRPFLNEILKGEIYADQLATSKALDNKHFKSLIDYTMGQLGKKYSAVVFNNAAHGHHLEKDGYYKSYREIISHIMKTVPASKIILSLGTPVRKSGDVSKMNDVWFEKMAERNNAAKKVAEEFGLTVNDLYSVVIDRSDLYWQDGIHFSDEGSKMLAEKTYEALKKVGI